MLSKLGINSEELNEAMREHGVEHIKDVKLAMMEIDGNISIVTTDKNQFKETHMADICASVQHRIVTILLNKLKKASEQTGIKDICIAGGVSANSGLRKGLQQMGEKLGWNTFIPAFQYCTDNAAMIAITAYYKYLDKDFAALDIEPSARAEW